MRWFDRFRKGYVKGTVEVDMSLFQADQPDLWCVKHDSAVKDKLARFCADTPSYGHPGYETWTRCDIRKLEERK